MRLHLEHCFQFWSSQSMTNIDILNGVHQEGRDLEHLMYKEKLRDVGLFILEKRRLWGTYLLSLTKGRVMIESDSSQRSKPKE